MSDAPLLDTHAWIWSVQGDPRLGRHIIQKLDDLPADDRPAVSDMSLWEVGMTRLGFLVDSSASSTQPLPRRWTNCGNTIHTTTPIG